jgi:hypothetical protein
VSQGNQLVALRGLKSVYPSCYIHVCSRLECASTVTGTTILSFISVFIAGFFWVDMHGGLIRVV